MPPRIDAGLPHQPIPQWRRYPYPQEASVVSNSAITIAAAPLNTDLTALPLGTGSAGGSLTFPSETFTGLGGSAAAITLTTTSTSPLSAVPSASSTQTAVASTSTSTKAIPIGAVAAAFAIVGVLCIILIAFFWWKRRNDKKKLAARRSRRRQRSDARKSYVGGYGYAKDEEGPWEEFKNASIESDAHIPGVLPSPMSTSQFSQSQSNQSHLLAKISTATVVQHARHYSVKSTVTGRINPSNNFADIRESMDEDDGEDGKSSRSRPPLSPMSAHPPVHHLSPAPRLPASLSVPDRTAGHPMSFLTFRSGENDFPPQPQSVAFVQPTPAPARALTVKSLKGAAASQDGHAPMPKNNRRGTKDVIALNNLIAALDTTDDARKSLDSYRTYDNSPSPVDAYTVPSPNNPTPSPTRNPNPFLRHN